jgi:CheY-like chemotaxis protein
VLLDIVLPGIDGYQVAPSLPKDAPAGTATIRAEGTMPSKPFAEGGA